MTHYASREAIERENDALRAENAKLRAALLNLTEACEVELAVRGDKPHPVVKAARAALGRAGT